MKTQILNNLADVGSYLGYFNRKVAVELNDEESIVLADILSMCNIARIESVDNYDNIFKFMIQGDSPFTVEYDEDETVTYGVEDSIWRITLGEYTTGRGQVHRFMNIECASKKPMLQPCATFTDDAREDLYDTKLPYRCMPLLSQIRDKIHNIVSSSRSIIEYNESLTRLIPEYQYVYYVKRSDLPDKRIMKNMSPEDRQKLKFFLVAHKEDINLHLSNNAITSVITPDKYLRSWVTAHMRKDIPADMTWADICKYFAEWNPKGRELLEKITRDDDWMNPAILSIWVNEYSCFHCCDVIYARTHMYPHGMVLTYSNSTSYYVEEFLESLASLDKISGGILCIRDAEVYADMLDDKDFIRLTPGWVDKYIRNYQIPMQRHHSYVEMGYNMEDVAAIDLRPHYKVNEYCLPIVSRKNRRDSK